MAIKRPRLKRFYIISVISYALVILWLVIAKATEGQTTITVCPSRLLYDFPCPGCGITRATLLALSGKPADALTLNPNVIFSFLYIVGFPVLCVTSLICKQHILYYLFIQINNLLHEKSVLLALIILELIIWFNNLSPEI